MRKGVPKRFLCRRLSEADSQIQGLGSGTNGNKGLFFIGDTGNLARPQGGGRWASYMVQRGKSIKFIDFRILFAN